jgi:hypothetical protein
MMTCRTIGMALLLVFLCLIGSGAAHAAALPDAHTLVIDELGKGLAPLDGSWQFHLGDNPAWADPAFDDDNWEQLRLSSTTARSFSPELYRWA